MFNTCPRFDGDAVTRGGGDVDAAILDVMSHLKPADGGFMWLLTPSSTPADLGARLEVGAAS